MKSYRVKLDLKLRYRFLFMSLNKCFSFSTVLLICPIMAPCSSHLLECHCMVRSLRGTRSSIRRSCSLEGLQMLLSLIAESVKVSLGKYASQIWERRRVPHGPTTVHLKGNFFSNAWSSMPMCELTFGHMMPEEWTKDDRTATWYNPPVLTPPSSVKTLFFHGYNIREL